MKPRCFSVYHQGSHVRGHEQKQASFCKQVRFPLPHIPLRAYAKLACKPTSVSYTQGVSRMAMPSNTSLLQSC